MLFLRYAITPSIALLLFICAFLLKASQHQDLSAILAAAFDDQFKCLERLALSPTRPIPYIKSLRVHSVSFEDLSYLLAGSSDEDLSSDVRSLSLDIDAFATLVQRFYVEVDLLVHLTTATSHIFGKLLERQPTDRLSQHLCRTLRLQTLARCQPSFRLSFALHNHQDTLSHALMSIDSLVVDVLLSRQRLQHRVEAVIATIARTTDLPVGGDCDLFLALWNLLDADGEGFSTSTRNAAAFRTFCVNLAHLGQQLDQDMASVRALQDVLAVFCSSQAVLIHLAAEPAFSIRLIERAEATLRLRMGGRQGHIHDRHHATIEA